MTYGSLWEAKQTAYALGQINRVDVDLSPGLYAVPGKVVESFSCSEDSIAVVCRDAPEVVCRWSEDPHLLLDDRQEGAGPQELRLGRRKHF